MEILRVWITHEDGAKSPLGVLMYSEAGENGNFHSVFRYSSEWLKNPRRFALDSECLPLNSQEWPSPNLTGPLRVFATAIPTGWCRRRLQRKADLPPAKRSYAWLLPEMSVALGALSFRPLSDKAAPSESIVELRDLSALAADIEMFERKRGEVQSSEMSFPNAGLNLHGKTPKATVWDNGLWVAKFPLPTDKKIDAGGVEATIMRAAKQAGLYVVDTKQIDLPNGNKALLSRRFDETPRGGRYYCLPVFYWLHDKKTQCLGYDDIFTVVERISCEPEIDAFRLFQMAVFNGMTGNTHDFADRFWLRKEENGWRLAPATGLTATFDKGDHALCFEVENTAPKSEEEWICMASAWGIDEQPALETLHNIRDALQDTAVIAWERGINDSSTMQLVKYLRRANPWFDIDSGLDETPMQMRAI